MAQRCYSTMVCCGLWSTATTMCISNEEDVYSFGSSNTRAHGHQEEFVFPPKVISSLVNIKLIDCSINHSICLDNNGNVFTFGSNDYGALGKNKNELPYSYEPQHIHLPPMKQVTCNFTSSFCVTEDGILYSFGGNHCGQLCLGHALDTHFDSPQKVEYFTNIDFIECGDHFAVCKTLEGVLYAWGDNDFGQLGTGNLDRQIIPKLCSNWPNNIVDIKCGSVMVLVLTLEQEVYSCGDNHEDKLGRKTKDEYSTTMEKIDSLSEIVKISCGSDHSMCIDIYNNLFVFGSNYYGELGLGDSDSRHEPIKHPLSDIIDISSGGMHTFVKNSSNEIYAFGYNKFSQCGTNSTNDAQLSPIQVLQNNENIWWSNIRYSKVKSARK